jgi:hypothetical protein
MRILPVELKKGRTLLVQNAHVRGAQGEKNAFANHILLAHETFCIENAYKVTMGTVVYVGDDTQ